ncbi:alpha beta hydrolase fold-3 domain containing protein [Colletotrichum karsti]|uniref:Alpha beta hydrolase fold-3 domain containing protein n=1 Tax=Colletotrichum karsti TaxID=1095194 RepID=A0A9P6LKE0_9PEZI|nr:alpha beta hydrolase fold-3 domain containing protein [Colletotrichum karsti]KAF9876658.1 alpha beta hydrolase fold-3 domain containing protein [Colletotrichum karsti]
MADTKGQGFPILSYQPLRFLYQLSGSFFILSCLPVWSFQALIPACRPHPKWGFKQTLMARLTRSIVDLYSNVGITETHTLKAGKEGDRFQTVEPFPSDLYRGPLVSNPDVKPATVGGTWFPEKTDVESGFGGTVVLQVHGGAFVLGDGRTGYCGFMAKMLMEKSGADAVFAPQYRLSGYGSGGAAAENPFPAALQDVLTSYLYLTKTLGIPSQRVVLCGDSAGGNLVIALLRYLETFGQELGLALPSCAVLIAPWVNPLASLGPDSVYKQHEHWSTDYLPVSFLRWGAKVYSSGVAEENMPYVTPLGNAWKTEVPVFVSMGEAEILETDGTAWCRQMQEAGGNVEVSYEEHAVHDTMLMGAIVGWEDSAQAVAARIGEFIRQVQKGTELDVKDAA